MEVNSYFRKTNWKFFNFFLSAVYEYWLSLVYNMDEQTFFTLFSSFLSSLWDRCSYYEKIYKYRPPWPPSFVLLAKTVNRARRKYRRNRSFSNLQYFLYVKELFINERSQIQYSREEDRISWMTVGQNIWKFAKPHFRSFTPPFRGLSVDKNQITDPQEVADIVANYFEKTFSGANL